LRISLQFVLHPRFWEQSWMVDKNVAKIGRIGFILARSISMGKGNRHASAAQRLTLASMSNKLNNHYLPIHP